MDALNRCLYPACLDDRLSLLLLHALVQYVLAYNFLPKRNWILTRKKCLSANPIHNNTHAHCRESLSRSDLLRKKHDSSQRNGDKKCVYVSSPANTLCTALHSFFVPFIIAFKARFCRLDTFSPPSNTFNALLQTSNI